MKLLALGLVGVAALTPDSVRAGSAQGHRGLLQCFAEQRHRVTGTSIADDADMRGRSGAWLNKSSPRH